MSASRTRGTWQPISDYCDDHTKCEFRSRRSHLSIPAPRPDRGGRQTENLDAFLDRPRDRQTRDGLGNCGQSRRTATAEKPAVRERNQRLRPPHRSGPASQRRENRVPAGRPDPAPRGATRGARHRFQRKAVGPIERGSASAPGENHSPPRPGTATRSRRLRRIGANPGSTQRLLHVNHIEPPAEF